MKRRKQLNWKAVQIASCWFPEDTKVVCLLELSGIAWFQRQNYKICLFAAKFVLETSGRRAGDANRDKGSMGCFQMESLGSQIERRQQIQQPGGSGNNRNNTIATTASTRIRGSATFVWWTNSDEPQKVNTSCCCCCCFGLEEIAIWLLNLIESNAASWAKWNLSFKHEHTKGNFCSYLSIKITVLFSLRRFVCETRARTLCKSCVGIGANLTRHLLDICIASPFSWHLNILLLDSNSWIFFSHLHQELRFVFFLTLTAKNNKNNQKINNSLSLPLSHAHDFRIRTAVRWRQRRQIQFQLHKLIAIFRTTAPFIPINSLIGLSA